jgi:hypothetical protein
MREALRYVPLIGRYVKIDWCGEGESDDVMSGVVQAVIDTSAGPEILFGDGSSVIIEDPDGYMIAVYARVPDAQ